MKTSILIPCIPEHFIYLDRVIDAYRNGTRKPFEFIVVLSDCAKVPREYLSFFIEKQQKYYDVRYCEYEVLLYTGEACSVGEQNCNGDIILIQAADDLPHPRRVEIVQKYFKGHDIVALNHSFYGKDMMEYYGKKNLENKFNYDNIKVYQPQEVIRHFKEHPLDVYGQFCDCHVAAGTLCYRRDIVGKFKWSNKRRGQDTITCKRIIHKFNKSIIIDAPLYYYFK